MRRILSVAFAFLAAAAVPAHGIAQSPLPSGGAMPVPPVRAAYLTSFTAGSGRFEEFLALLETTELNALVIDLKDAHGRLAFAPLSRELQPLAPDRPTIRDLGQRVEAIHARGGKAIARLFVFQDTWYADRALTEALRTPNREMWRDGIGGAWLDPASPRTWAYAVAVAREAALLGFDEVNLDYIRFPSDGPGFTDIQYPRWDGATPKREVLRAFSAYMDREVRQWGIPLSADLFGLVFWSDGDLGIGQQLEILAPYYDVLAPMVYPSHYRRGFLGKANPALFPNEVIRATLDRGRARLTALPDGQRPIVRPWLQDFDLGAPYGVPEIHAQVRAAEETGSLGWMLWNSRNRYTTEALRDR